jgi:acetyl esterase/lipase
MNRQLITSGVAVLITFGGSASQAEQPPQRLALWEGQAPVGGGETEKANAYITVFRPTEANGAAAIICPGGGYKSLKWGPEGTGIAKWLNRHGILGAVLKYRMPNGKPYRPLYDAQRAIRMVRSKAKEWNVDAERIGIMGFSAGGHLASSASTLFDREVDFEDPLETISARPAFTILVYPVVTMGPGTHAGSRRSLLGSNPDEEMLTRFSSEQQVTDGTPPAFLAHAVNDTAVPPANSENYYNALRARKIPAEYLKLPSGGHGLNRYSGPMWDAWQSAALKWLRALGFLPAAASR